MYQKNLLGHFKNNSNINLELFDLIPDFPTIYSDVNSFTDLNTFTNTEELTDNDLININNNNNIIREDDLTINDSFDISDKFNSKTFDLNSFKQNLNSICLKIFEYFISFVYFIYKELKNLNQSERIKLVKRFMIITIILSILFVYYLLFSKNNYKPTKLKLHWLQSNLDHVCISLSNFLQDI
jgi:hypothetical protein